MSTKADKARIDYLIGQYFATDTLLATAEDDMSHYDPEQLHGRPELLAALRVSLDEWRVQLLAKRKEIDEALMALGVDLRKGDWAREDFQPSQSVALSACAMTVEAGGAD